MRKDDRVIILENNKFIWSHDEIALATKLFSFGVKPSEVAKIMNESVVDIGLLLIHLTDKGKVKRMYPDQIKNYSSEQEFKKHRKLLEDLKKYFFGRCDGDSSQLRRIAEEEIVLDWHYRKWKKARKENIT